MTLSSNSGISKRTQSQAVIIWYTKFLVVWTKSSRKISSRLITSRTRFKMASSKSTRKAWWASLRLKRSNIILNSNNSNKTSSKGTPLYLQLTCRRTRKIWNKRKVPRIKSITQKTRISWQPPFLLWKLTVLPKWWGTRCMLNLSRTSTANHFGQKREAVPWTSRIRFPKIIKELNLRRNKIS